VTELTPLPESDAVATRSTVVVVTYDALPWIERCLESVARAPTIVVDCGSRDGTVASVRSRFPHVTVIAVENRGLGAAWNVGLRSSESRYVLLLNADSWLAGDALSRLVAFADGEPRAAVVAPRRLTEMRSGETILRRPRLLTWGRKQGGR